MPRTLHALSCPSGSAALDVWEGPLAAALNGTGPALLPVPDGPSGHPVAEMARLDEPLERDDVALVVPTSGSTGLPKGALLTADAIDASGRATYARIGGPGRWLLALPITHIAGLQVLARSLLAGTTPVVLDLTGGFEPAAFAAGTTELGPGRRYTSVVPTQLVRLLEAGPDVVEALRSYDAVLLGGSAAPPALLQRAADAGIHVVTTYGMSETCGGSVYDGEALDGVRVALDEVGRIRLGGEVVFSGYRLRPDLTAEALVEEAGLRWHVTKDLGRLHDDRLDVQGRLDDLIVTGGEKVAPLAVEAALTALPEVRDAVVVGVPDLRWGQRVVAVVVPAEGAVPELDAIRTALRERLPAHAAPKQLDLVAAVPLLASGKPDRAVIRDQVASRDRVAGR